MELAQRVPAKFVFKRRYTKGMCCISEDVLVSIWYFLHTLEALNIFITNVNYLCIFNILINNRQEEDLLY